MSEQKRPNLVSVTTINQDGSRYFLHPTDVRGKWTTLRRLVALVLIIIYVALPWIPVGGHPAVFLDVEYRTFHLFGFSLPPQDLWVLFFGITGMGFALFVVTSLLGRIWCGWACPYTVFLDHVYRRIERWIEGDALERKALDAAPWTGVKIIKRVSKHALYALIAALIAHVFLSYFVSLKRLYGFMQEGPMEHATAFGIVLFLTLVLWFCFGYFREQFCIIMCPYGRLQSALTDDDTINIGYDAVRGEPRGTKGKAEGDCIDCKRCVQVCPTGIDIRNGLQLECIGCTACIDACDDVMTRLERPKGLIRYDSFNAFGGKGHRWLRPRVYAYCVFAVLGVAAMFTVASMKLRPFHLTVTHSGAVGFLVDASSVRNIYKLRLINKRSEPVTLKVRLGKGTPEGYTISGGEASFKLGANEESTRSCIVEVPLSSYKGMEEVIFEATSDKDGAVMQRPSSFRGPNPETLQRPSP